MTGIKMAVFRKIPSAVSLGIIAAILTLSVVASLWKSRREERAAALAETRPEMQP